MKRKLVLFLLLAASICVAQKGYYRGNTHTHSYPQSGDAATTWTTATIVASYKAAGYDFLVFTDHVSYWNASSLSSSEFTVISGEEAGLSGGGRWGHFTAMKIQSQIGSTGKTHQQLLDEIASQGGLAFLNHPRWNVIPISARQVINDMKQNLRHIEVFNWNTDTPTTFDTSLWDSVLTSGRLMFGVASDDAHKESHLGKGWICVYASSRHPDTLFNAIRNGEFYASNGIVLDTIGYRPNRIFVRSVNGSLIRFIGIGGTLLATVAGNEAAYNFKGNEGYVRAEISNTLNQTAWIQPFIISETTPVEGKEPSVVPESPVLFQNYPNPFNPTTTIVFRLTTSGFISLRVFDLMGREVSTLVSQQMQPGYHRVVWNATPVAGGTYLCRMFGIPSSSPGGAIVLAKKMTLLR